MDITKESVKQIIDGRDYAALVDFFDADQDRTRRFLTRLTYHPDDESFEPAVEGFRVLSAERSAENETFFLEILRRRIWAMNEEGGNNDWSAPEVACAVIAGNPALYGHFFSYVYYAACDELMFQPSLVRGYAIVQRYAPLVAEPFKARMDELRHHLSEAHSSL